MAAAVLQLYSSFLSDLSTTGFTTTSHMPCGQFMLSFGSVR